jgi:hypothetical protein
VIDLHAEIAHANRYRLVPPDDLYLAFDAPSARIAVTAGQSLQAAIDAAPDHAELTLEPGTYESPLALTRPVRVRARVVPRERVSSDVPLPVIVKSPSEIWISGGDVYLGGLGLSVTDPALQIVNLTGSRVLLDACQLLGDPAKGQRRGIRWGGVGTLLRRSAIDHCWRVGQEAHGILGTSGCVDGRIDDCSIAAASQAVMWGGVDPPSEDLNPRNQVISRSLLTKRRSWFDIPNCYIKTAFEAKNVFGFALLDSTCEYAGTSEQQSAFLCVLTPRNQSRTAPWSNVRDGLIERVRFRYGCGALSVQGDDNVHPSGRLENVTVRNVRFEDIDPLGFTRMGNTVRGRAIQIQRAPHNLTLDSLTISGRNLGALAYFVSANTPPPMGFRMRNVVATVGTAAGLVLDGTDGGQGLPRLLKWMPDAVIEDGPLTGARGYPGDVAA